MVAIGITRNIICCPRFIIHHFNISKRNASRIGHHIGVSYCISNNCSRGATLLNLDCSQWGALDHNFNRGATLLSGFYNLGGILQIVNANFVSFYPLPNLNYFGFPNRDRQFPGTGVVGNCMSINLNFNDLVG